MPCRYDPTQAEIDAARAAELDRAIAPIRADLDRLTHENDMLRELVLTSVHKQKPVQIENGLLATIVERQIAHRKEDLNRLEETLAERVRETSGAERKQAAIDLTAVLVADPHFPLAEQLGFDPDDY